MRDKPCCLSFEVGDPCHCECRKEIARLSQENAAMRRRLDATLIAALRYESRHDRDPERGQLWGELKMALMVDAAQPSQSGEEK